MIDGSSIIAGIKQQIDFHTESVAELKAAKA